MRHQTEVCSVVCLVSALCLSILLRPTQADPEGPKGMALNDDETPLPPIAGSRQGLVTMKIPMYSKKDVALAEDEVTALVEIKATSSTTVREGLDLVAVLDVSGSMEGHRIESSKKALLFVIMKLTPLDRLSIVTFNHTAERLCPLRSVTPAAQNEFKAIIGRLTADGGTDIGSGLVKGLDVLRDRVHTESRTANIFLMSDGETSGDPTTVDPGDVVVYTFGFGQGTDHELLTRIAKNSTGGTYNSVPDGTPLSTSFAQLLAGLVTVVAQNVRLTLNPNKRGLDLELMTVASGNDYKQTIDPSGLITIKFGNLFSGEVRTVAVDFKLKNREKEPRDFGATLAVAEHSYGAQERRQAPMNVRVNRKRNPSPPENTLEERTVQAEQLRRKHVDNIREASTLAHAEKLEQAREKVAEGQNAIEDIMLDDDERTLNVLRAELLQLYAYMDTQKLYNELGHPYALATILSHGRQRTAGRGDEQEVLSLYITDRMVTGLKQVKKFEENPNEPVPSADDDVKQEILSNPLAAVAAPLGFYLEEAIHALQAIQKLLADGTQR